VLTARLYAERKGWALTQIAARARREPARGPIERIHLTLALGGDLDAEQRARLVEVAGRCPVHRTLASGVRIEHA
jgi:putative redox protein